LTSNHIEPQDGVSDVNGKIVFIDLEPGRYILQETETPPGYELDDTKHPLVVWMNGTVTLGGQPIENMVLVNHK